MSLILKQFQYIKGNFAMWHLLSNCISTISKKTLFRLKDHFSSWSIWTKRSHVDQYFTINPWTIFDGISINPSSSTHNLLEQRAFSSYLPSFVIIPYSSWKEFLCILYFILPVDPTFGNLIFSNITKFISIFLFLKVHFGVQQVLYDQKCPG